jgi:hypothetical protein
MAELPLARPVLFPLFGVTSDGTCACGNPGCSRVGKHARVAWGDVEYGVPVPRPDPGAGWGLRTGAHPKGSDVFVVDLDSDAAAEAFDALGGASETYTVQTARGFHLYFKHPGFHVKTSRGDLAPKIDIRGDGGIVIAPGSPHKSGATYTELNSVEPIDAPIWLLEWLQKQRAPSEAQHYPGDVEGGQLAYHRKLYAEYLKTAPPSISEAGGDEALWNVVQHGAWDLLLPVEDVLELVAEHFDPRCRPPWGAELEAKVRRKADGAKTSSERPRVIPLPEDLAGRAVSGAEPMPDFSAFRAEPIEQVEDTPKGSMGETWGGWGKRVPPPVYLVEGLIPEHKVVTFFAEGGSVKTWSALALAIAVASGEPWLGKYRVKRGKVLYLDYEDGPYEVSRRVHLLSGGQDVPDLGYLYGGPQLNQVDDLWKTLGAKVKAEGISLVVADSLGAGMPGDADENTTAFAAGMKIAGRFTEAGCGVLFVHHANKNGGMRGTSAARDQSDVVFKFEPVSETDTVKRMRMICDKPGPQKKPKPVNVELTDSGLTTFEDEAADMARNATTKVGVAEAIKLALLSGPLLTVDKVRDAVRRDRTEVSKELRALVASNAVVEIEGVGYMLDDVNARTERVLECVRGFSGRETAAILGKRSYTSTRFVEDMARREVIVPRVVGNMSSGFMVRLASGDIDIPQDGI